jgi:hypothetical protein
MKKIIDIPDEIFKELKILAVKNDTDLKKYIQDLVSRHYEFSNITEMAFYGLKDGQSARFIWNYLIQTYEGIKEEKFDYGEIEFKSVIDFLDYVKDTCECAIEAIKNETQNK